MQDSENGTRTAGRPPSSRVCEIPGCDRKHKAKGLCSKHYKEQNQAPKAAPKASPGRPSLWLEKKEAEIITAGIQYGMLIRYGAITEEPDPKAQEHLAHVIKKYSTVFPLSTLQGFIRWLLPLRDPNAKPGRSTLGDLAQYVGAWHSANPDLYQEILAAENIYIPFITPPPEDPGVTQQLPVPTKQEVEQLVGRPIHDQQYKDYIRTEYGIEVAV